MRSTIAASVLALFTAASAHAGSVDIPEEFHGIWQYFSAHEDTKSCNNGMHQIKVTRTAAKDHSQTDSDCKAITTKSVRKHVPGKPVENITTALLVTMSCLSEEDPNKRISHNEIWTLTYQGDEQEPLLVTTDINDGLSSIYSKCVNEKQVRRR